MRTVSLFTSVNMLEVKNLYYAQEFYENVYHSIYSEWGEDNPRFWHSWIKSSIKESGVPSTYVVLKDDEYVGTFSLWLCDIQSRQDISPWVGGIVVDKAYRGEGIGLFIQQEVKKILLKNNIKTAYLFTDMVGFYEKSGWKFVELIYNEKDELQRLYRMLI